MDEEALFDWELNWKHISKQEHPFIRPIRFDDFKLSIARGLLLLSIFIPFRLICRNGQFLVNVDVCVCELYIIQHLLISRNRLKLRLQTVAWLVIGAIA